MRTITGTFDGLTRPGSTKTNGDFLLPVDGENKAAVFKPWMVRGVHMRAFHVSWLSFFTSFVSTFAPAAMIPVVRDDLNLTTSDIGHAGIASIAGNVISRVAMGTFCDTIGPRLGHASFMLLTAPAVFGIGLVTSASGFIWCRFLIGFSLSTFIACQFWSSVMFNVKIVGTANATGAGWGNSGGGATQLIMPLIYAAIARSLPAFKAWRYAFWIPGCMHLIVGSMVLGFAQDLPDGSYFQLRSRGQLQSAAPGRALVMGITNWRVWVLAVLYAFCFGVELTMNNIAVQYFFDHFDLTFRAAGVVASVFGLLNIFARSIGGVASDRAAEVYGMRGRLWSIWLIQTVEGVMCILVGLTQSSLIATVLLMVLFSLCVQAAEGAVYGVVPFVSKRALGVVTGFVGAGGNVGSVILQTAFFRSEAFETHEAIVLMGITVVVMTLTVIPLHFPMWGGMFFPASEGATEEEYYLSEYTDDEIAQGLAHRALAFASEARTQRGKRRILRELSEKRESL